MPRIRSDLALGLFVGSLLTTLSVLRSSNKESPQAQASTSQEVYEKSLDEYRRHLVDARQKAQESYDKTVLSLSGGSLGVSFAFLKSAVGVGPYSTLYLLFSAWILWTISATVVLISYFLSQMTLERAIAQVDSKAIDQGSPGGWLASATRIANLLSGSLFIIGVALMIGFVYNNVEIGSAG